MSQPALYDPIAGRHAHWWYPANQATQELHCILLACKQIVKLSASLDKAAPCGDAHGLTLLATPVITLLEHTMKLRKLTGRADRSYWPAEDRERLRESGRKLDGFSQGKLRLLRNRFAAHAGAELPELANFPHPRPDLLLPPLGNALIVALLLMNHEGVYQWTRTPKDKQSLEIIGQVCTAEGNHPPIAVEFGVAGDGTISSLKGLHFVEDPRSYARDEMSECVSVYNALASSSDPAHPMLQLREYEGPKELFRNMYSEQAAAADGFRPTLNGYPLGGRRQ